jgi:hypothetical protein
MILNYNESCFSVINTYNHLHSQLFPRPLSDDNFHKEMKKVHKIIKVEKMKHTDSLIGSLNIKASFESFREKKITKSHKRSKSYS